MPLFHVRFASPTCKDRFERQESSTKPCSLSYTFSVMPPLTYLFKASIGNRKYDANEVCNMSKIDEGLTVTPATVAKER